MAALATAQTIFLGLGSNQGDRLQLLRAALQRLAPHVLIQACSSLYETPPWGVTDQPPFLNAVARASTTLEPQALLRLLKQVEQALGRTPGLRYGPRPVDLDILLYGSLQLADTALQIPHPRIAERSFVLVPLAELAPSLRLQPAGPTVAKLLAARPDRAEVKKIGPPADLETGVTAPAVL
jgi:2-amino-4-hydroxy-6-hydroxymethyldihydropteridine diphosphokinase